MNTFLIILLVILMVLVVASLIRGIVAFMKSTKIDLESGKLDGIEVKAARRPAGPGFGPGGMGAKHGGGPPAKLRTSKK